MTSPLPSCEIRITQDLIDRYAQLSGDFNPIHVDPMAAAQSPFGGTIAHGCIPLEPVFQSLMQWRGIEHLPHGTRLKLRYRAPSRPGDTIRSELTLIPHDRESPSDHIRVTFTCVNQHGHTVLDGECEWQP